MIEEDEAKIRALAKRSAELIRKGWVKYKEAQDAQGRHVTPESPDACKFCASGAIKRSTKELNGNWDLERVIFRKFESVCKCSCIIYFNDWVAITSEDVARVFDQIAEGSMDNGL